MLVNILKNNKKNKTSISLVFFVIDGMDVEVEEVDDGMVVVEVEEVGQNACDDVEVGVAEQHNNEQLVLAYRCIPLNQCTFQRL
jgi:hypothetical protein